MSLGRKFLDREEKRIVLSSLGVKDLGATSHWSMKDMKDMLHVWWSYLVTCFFIPQTSHAGKHVRCQIFSGCGSDLLGFVGRCYGCSCCMWSGNTKACCLHFVANNITRGFQAYNDLVWVTESLLLPHCWTCENQRLDFHCRCLAPWQYFCCLLGAPTGT